MGLFKAQEITLSFRVYRYSLRRITDKDLSLINSLLASYQYPLPNKVGYIDHVIPFDATLKFYRYFVRVYNAVAFIKNNRMTANRLDRKEIGALLRRLTTVADISITHIENIAQAFGRNHEVDFLIY